MTDVSLPGSVTIVEVGPRDGLQNEAAEIPTDVKRGFIDRLGAAGLRVIEATSFVHPRAIPQLADADALFPSIDRRPGVRYPVLVPTRRGLERAVAAGADEIAVVIGATDSFNRANLNRTTEEALADAASVITDAQARSMRVRGYVSVAFGCPYQGEVAPATTAARGGPAARPRLRRDQPGRHDRGGDPRRRRTRPRRCAPPGQRRARRAARPRHARPGPGQRLCGARAGRDGRSTARRAASAGARSPVRARLATSRPRTWSTCSTACASSTGSASRV